MTPSNKQNNLDAVQQTIAKHFPDEAPHELLARMQSLLKFVATIDPKILAYSSKNPSLHTQQPGGMFTQYKNASPQPARQIFNSEQDKIRKTLLGQITKIQDISHLEPAVRISAARKLK
jgi:hypothetical protein